MKRRNLCNILIFLFCSLLFVPLTLSAQENAVSIYGGTQVKLDILSPAIVAGMSKGDLQHYEIATNVRLAQRFYPTLELGYAGGKTIQGDSISYSGLGGFFRVGVDICPLKKHPESPHALLVGVRLGTSVQEFENGENLKHGIKADCWGEIVLGCQVEIAKVNKTSFYTRSDE